MCLRGGVDELYYHARVVRMSAGGTQGGLMIQFDDGDEFPTLDELHDYSWLRVPCRCQRHPDPAPPADKADVPAEDSQVGVDP